MRRLSQSSLCIVSVLIAVNGPFAPAPAVAQGARGFEVSAGYQLAGVKGGVDETLGKRWYADVAGSISSHFAALFQAGGNDQTFNEITVPPRLAREEVVAEASPGSEVIAVRATAVSDAEPRIAWIEKTRAGQSVMLDGRQVGGPYDEVRAFEFLGGRLTWIGKTKSKWVLGVDVELPGSYSDMSRPAATATGRVAAGVCHDKRCRLLLDGQEVGPEFEDVSLVAFSPDGAHYVYAGKRRKQWVALLDGVELGSPFEGWLAYRWGNDSRLAVAVHLGDKSTWIVDGKLGPFFDAIGQIAFSRDGRHFAYGGANARRGVKEKAVESMMVVDGTPLSSTFAGKGMLGGWANLIGAGQSIARGVKTLSPDFHGVSDPAYTGAGELVFGRRLPDGGVQVQVGEQSGPVVEDIVSPIVVSPDGTHVAYVAEVGDMFVEVRDQSRGPELYGKRDISFVGWISFTGTGRLAYEVVRGGSEFKAGRTPRALRRIVVDGQVSPEYDAFDIVCKWRDGEERQACLVVGAEGTRDRLLIDGMESSLYDDVPWGSVTFPMNAAVQFIGRRDRRFFRVTVASPN